jgi:excisionase family DNA binding protein
MIDAKSILLSVDEAADYLNLSGHTLRSWVHQKRLPFIKLGSRVLFRPEDLESFINSNAIQPENYSQKGRSIMETKLCALSCPHPACTKGHGWKGIAKHLAPLVQAIQLLHMARVTSPAGKKVSLIGDWCLTGTPHFGWTITIPEEEVIAPLRPWLLALGFQNDEAGYFYLSACPGESDLGSNQTHDGGSLIPEEYIGLGTLDAEMADTIMGRIAGLSEKQTAF